MEDEAKDDVKEAVADGDKEAEKIEAEVNKEDADFDPENPEEDVEPVPADKADDAGECSGLRIRDKAPASNLAVFTAPSDARPVSAII